MAEINPPYIKFEKRPIEDRDATISQGRFVSKDVTYALITPAGTKDEIVKEAEAWLRDTRTAAQDGRIPAVWLEHYERLYDNWKKGQELPEFGTPIRSWPMLSPAQVENVLGANIRTVEDLANASETGLAMIGLGARALQDQAKAWLDSAEKDGKPAAELNALRKENESLKKLNEGQAARIVELEGRVAAAERAVA